MLTRLCILALALAFSFAAAFQPTVRQPFRVGTHLGMGLFDFNKFGGSGSASQEELDDMWEIQQEILRERQGHGSKDALKKKYKKPTSGGPSLGGGKAKASKAPAARNKFPWEK